MCGIAGYYGSGDIDILKKMARTLEYRGPDDEGYYVLNNVGIGHKRLSIIDLSKSGKQPMSNEDGTLSIVFNGEIYNYQELRKELKTKHKFNSKTDTEVILHLYEEIGNKVFEKLDGMFALALYDKKSGEIILARDRFGKKPLYWAVFDHTLIFASEMKALMKHPSFVREIDLQSLNKYFIYEYIPTPNSIFKNVYKLEAGSYLRYNGAEIIKNEYYDIEFEKSNKIEEPAILDELDQRMESAVKKRLISDVPLGIFLSGGIDSSAIAYYAQKNSKEKIKTFSIGFNEASFDESSYARKVAKHLKTDHYEKILSEKDSLDILPKIAHLLDEPMADPSIIPTYLLSEFTKNKVTVALGGDGGDELFCGYDTFVAHRLAEYYEKIPNIIKNKIIENCVEMLPTSFNNISIDFKAKRFISGFKIDKKYRNQEWMSAFGEVERKKLFKDDVYRMIKKEDEYEEIDKYVEKKSGDDYYDQLIYQYFKMYLMDDILVKVDRASMFNSLEVRAPMLDRELVNFVNSLPLEYKMNRLKTKYILKKLMENKLPKDIVYRKKKGFGIPVAYWINNNLKELVLCKLGKKRIESQGFFSYSYIDKILQEHFSRKKDNRKQIWTLLMFQLWYDKWSS